MALTSERCEACHVGAPKVTDEEMEQLKPQIPDWQVTEVKGGVQLAITMTIAAEGESKPACVVTILVRQLV